MFIEIYNFIQKFCKRDNKTYKFIKLGSSTYFSCHDITSKIKFCEKYTESYLGSCHPFTILYDDYGQELVIKHGNKIKLNFKAQTFYPIPNDLKFFYQMIEGKCFFNTFTLNIPQMIPFNIFMMYINRVKKENSINVRIDLNDWFCFMSIGDYYDNYFSVYGTYAINLNRKSIFYQNVIFIKNSQKSKIFYCSSTFSKFIEKINEHNLLIHSDDLIKKNVYPFDLNYARTIKNKIIILCEMKFNCDFIFNNVPLDILKIIFEIKE